MAFGTLFSSGPAPYEESDYGRTGDRVLNNGQRKKRYAGDMGDQPAAPVRVDAGAATRVAPDKTPVNVMAAIQPPPAAAAATVGTAVPPAGVLRKLPTSNQYGHIEAATGQGPTTIEIPRVPLPLPEGREGQVGPRVPLGFLTGKPDQPWEQIAQKGAAMPPAPARPAVNWQRVNTPGQAPVVTPEQARATAVSGAQPPAQVAQNALVVSPQQPGQAKGAAPGRDVGWGVVSPQQPAGQAETPEADRALLSVAPAADLYKQAKTGNHAALEELTRRAEAKQAADQARNTVTTQTSPATDAGWGVVSPQTQTIPKTQAAYERQQGKDQQAAARAAGAATRRGEDATLKAYEAAEADAKSELDRIQKQYDAVKEKYPERAAALKAQLDAAESRHTRASQETARMAANRAQARGGQAPEPAEETERLAAGLPESEHSVALRAAQAANPGRIGLAERSLGQYLPKKQALAVHDPVTGKVVIDPTTGLVQTVVVDTPSRAINPEEALRATISTVAHPEAQTSRKAGIKVAYDWAARNTGDSNADAMMSYLREKYAKDVRSIEAGIPGSNPETPAAAPAAPVAPAAQPVQRPGAPAAAPAPGPRGGQYGPQPIPESWNESSLRQQMGLELGGIQPSDAELSERMEELRGAQPGPAQPGAIPKSVVKGFLRANNMDEKAALQAARKAGWRL